MRYALLGVVLLAWPGAATATETKVAVIAAGEDAIPVAELQRAMEERLLRVRHLHLMGAAEVGLLLNPYPDFPEDDPSVMRSVDVALRDAKQAFYRGDYDAVLPFLDAAALEVVKLPRGGERAAELELWRAASHLAAGREGDARLAVRDALHINPELEVDLSVFFPSVVDVVEAERDRLELRTLTLANLPEDSVVRVDARQVQLPAQVTAGTHRLTVLARGFAGWERELDIQTDTTLDGNLPIQVGTFFNKKLREAVWDGEARQQVDDLRVRLDVDALVLLVRYGDSTRAVVSRPGVSVAVSPFTPNENPAAVVKWVARRLDRRGIAWRWTIDGGVGFKFWERDLKWDQSRIKTSARGGGLRINAQARRGPWVVRTGVGGFGHGRTKVLTKNVTPTTVIGPNASLGDVDGRASFDFHLAGGRQWGFFRDTTQTQMVAYVRGWQVFANDPVPAGGSGTHIVSNYTALSAGLEGRLQVGLFATRFYFGLALALAPLDIMLESPWGSAGRPVLFGGNEGGFSMWLMYQPADAWQIHLGLDYAQGEFGFSGQGRARVSPVVEKAHISTRDLVPYLTLRHTF